MSNEKTAEEKFKLGTDLIKKHLENWDGLTKASIDNYAQTGKVSGSLYTSLLKMMEEFHTQFRNQPSGVKLPDDNEINNEARTFITPYGKQTTVNDRIGYFVNGAKWMRNQLQPLPASADQEMIEFEETLLKSNYIKDGEKWIYAPLGFKPNNPTRFTTAQLREQFKERK